MKPLVIYHKNCADGFGAAFAAWLKFGDDAYYIPVQYGTVQTVGDFDEKIATFTQERDIYILDFSFPKVVMDTLFKYGKHVIWLDHHKTAFELYNMSPNLEGVEGADAHECEVPNRHWVELDNNRSGAVLAWEYFHPDKQIPALIKHIDDYDRWQFKLEGTKEFNKALWVHAPWTFKQWEAILFWGSVETERMIQEGTAILLAHDKNVMSIVEGAGKSCTIQDPNPDHNEMPWWTGLSANCPPHLSSDVGHQLANRSETFGLLWYINKEGKCLCSLRSNGKYDVSAIAKKFGGGGHMNAAGFEIPIQTLLEWIK
jgi:oligoribonuclease NrnB/cAMP/cGMP phosphodiesterase (DHH superfamily)